MKLFKGYPEEESWVLFSGSKLQLKFLKVNDRRIQFSGRGGLLTELSSMDAKASLPLMGAFCHSLKDLAPSGTFLITFFLAYYSSVAFALARMLFT